MPPTNTAAWLPAPSIKPLEVKSAPYTPPGKHQVLIRAHAIAINPVDAGKQLLGNLMMSWIQYPFIGGCDVAGEILEVGASVTRFRPGDRVTGHAAGMDKRVNRASESAFQHLVILRDNMASTIPDLLTYEKACVMPLCLSTAACGLFMKDYLALDMPSPEISNRGSKGETLVVWGGSTSVGCNAIQLGVAAGYDVITTSSPKNFEFVKGLGAREAFDYKDAGKAVDDIIKVLEGKTIAGALAIGGGSLEACISIVAACKGKKFVAQASIPSPKSLPPKGLSLVAFLATYLWFNVSTALRCRWNGVGAKFIWGGDLRENEVSKAVYEDYLPEALKNGTHVAAPEPHVLGEGLEKIQEGLDAILKGVSLRKLVVKI